jgi:hypothetical protein
MNGKSIVPSASTVYRFEMSASPKTVMFSTSCAPTMYSGDAGARETAGVGVD